MMIDMIDFLENPEKYRKRCVDNGHDPVMVEEKVDGLRKCLSGALRRLWVHCYNRVCSDNGLPVLTKEEEREMLKRGGG